jgi:hypothetical protein
VRVSEDVTAKDGGGLLSSVSVDWWATILAGIIVVLAVADVLPKIPW